MSQLNTINEAHMIAELDAWSKFHNRKPESVDEMLEYDDLTQYQQNWLAEFANRWTFAEEGHLWIQGYLNPPESFFTEHRAWIASAEYQQFFSDWDVQFIPEGYEDAKEKP